MTGIQAAVADIAFVAVFLYGILFGKISGEILLSSLALKSIIVTIGGYFICYYIIRLIKAKQAGHINIKRAALYILFTAFSVFCMHIQQIVSFKSLFGYVFAFLVYENLVIRVNKKDGENRIIKISAAGFALIHIFGYLSKIAQSIHTKQFDIEMLAILSAVFVFWWLVWMPVLFLVLAGMEKLGVVWSEKPDKQPKGKRNRVFVLVMAFICYIPYFLNYYPGILSRDSVNQMEQVMGKAEYSNHHPIFHTMFIKFCYLLGSGWGKSEVNSGVAAYTIFSMLLMALTAAVVWTWLCKRGIPLYFRIGAMVFYMLFPINGAFAITMWKDIIFSCAMLLYMICTDYIHIHCNKKEKVPRLLIVSFIILGFLVCVLRGNGIYVWIFSLPFIIFMLKDKIKSMIKAAGIIFILFLIFKSGITMYGVKSPDFVESLSIPIQQIAYTVAEGGNISEDEYVLLEKIIDVEEVPDAYKEYISDPIKYLIREKGNQQYLTENKGKYLMAYVSIGLKNPYCYTQAFINQTKGYWFHKTNNWIYYSEGMLNNDLGIVRENKLPEAVSKLLEKSLSLSENLYHKYFSLALQTYCVMLCIVYALWKRKPIGVYMPLLGLVLTLLVATPVCAEFRYAYALFIALPVLPALALSDTDNTLPLA